MIELREADKTFRDIHAADHISTTIQDGMDVSACFVCFS